MNKSRLTEGNPLQVILRFMFPLLLGNIFQQLYNMADTIIVGRFVGQDALAAVGSTGTIIFLIIGLVSGLASGFTVMTAQRFGAKDVDGTRRSVSNAIVLSVLIVLLMTILSVSLMHQILHLLNTPKEIYHYAYDYIIVICQGLFCTVFYNLFAAMMRAVGNSKMPLILLIFSACLNVVLDLVMIINLGLETRGAALATVISQGVSVILAGIYIVTKIPDLRIKRDFYRIDFRMLEKQLIVGIPMALQFGITASGTMILQAAVNTYGAVAVAAYTAANKVQSLLTQGHLSLGQTMAAYTGQNYGAGRVDRIHQGVRAAMKTNVVYSLVTGGIALGLLQPMMHLFFTGDTDFAAMMPYAWPYVIACVVCFIPLGMIFIFRNTMQGCGFGLMPMMGGVVELFCRLSFALTSIYTGIYLLTAFSDAFAWVGAGIFTWIAYMFLIKKVEKKLAEADSN